MAQPTSTEQHEVNAAAIARLRAEMIELATWVIEANRGVHEVLTKMLAERNELAYDDVLPVLSRVQPVPGAPIPHLVENHCDAPTVGPRLYRESAQLS